MNDSGALRDRWIMNDHGVPQDWSEYRKRSPYWRKRLEDRNYDALLFRNGYAKDAPEMLVKFRGFRRYGKGRTAYYASRLGRILKIRRWP